MTGPSVPPNGPNGGLGRWRMCLHMWWMSQQLAIKANVVLMCLGVKHHVSFQNDLRSNCLTRHTSRWLMGIGGLGDIH